MIAGPTLDSRYPDVWATFRPGAGKQCAYLTNGGDNPGTASDVEFVGARIEGQDPSSTPRVFRLYTPPLADCLERTDVDLDDRTGCYDGFVLPLAAPDRAKACLIGLETTAPTGTDWTATLIYSFRVTCTSTSIAPCDDPDVEQASPTTDDPVHVTWEQPTQVFACFADPADNSPTDLPGSDPQVKQCPDRGGG